MCQNPTWLTSESGGASFVNEASLEGTMPYLILYTIFVGQDNVLQYH